MFPRLVGRPGSALNTRHVGATPSSAQRSDLVPVPHRSLTRAGAPGAHEQRRRLCGSEQRRRARRNGSERAATRFRADGRRLASTRDVPKRLSRPPPVLSAPCIRGCRGFQISYNHETRRRCVRPGLTQHTQIRSLYETSVSVHCSRPIQGTGPSRSGPEAPGLHCPPLHTTPYALRA